MLMNPHRCFAGKLLILILFLLFWKLYSASDCDWKRRTRRRKLDCWNWRYTKNIFLVRSGMDGKGAGDGLIAAINYQAFFPLLPRFLLDHPQRPWDP